MRLTKEKLLKTMNRIADNNTDEPIETWTDDAKGEVFLDSCHAMAVVPYNLDLLFAQDRANKWGGRIRGVITKNNWLALGTSPSKVLNRTIRDAKTSPKKYPIMKIDDTPYDTKYIYDFIKHYNRVNDYIEFFGMLGDTETPIVMTSSAKEWMCILAPRIVDIGETIDDFETLYKSKKDEQKFGWGDEIETPKTFNPLTGEFE